MFKENATLNDVWYSALFLGDCLEIDTNYPGEDINNNEKTNSVIECQRLCQQNIDCKIFTYRVNKKECWLKSIKALKNRKSERDCISGKRICPIQGMSSKIKGN